MDSNTSPPPIQRIVGHHDANAHGPTVVAVTAIHGNEPASVHASTRVLEKLAEGTIPTKGRFVAVAGNLPALKAGKRFIDNDLNRAWDPEHVARVKNGQITTVEDQQQIELVTVLAELEKSSRGPMYFLDLHSSSAHGSPFATVGDTLRNRAFARQIPVPLVLGIEEQIDGGLLEYVNNHGHVTMGFEAGRHDDPETANRHEALIWMALKAAGVIETIPDAPTHVDVLRRASEGLPRIVEVRGRHHIEAGDNFRMAPGWRHFQPVQKGALLATDKSGEIRADAQGLVLLPLYQGQGSDGFFMAREVRPFWLGVSKVLRTMGAPKVVHWLPGVRRQLGDTSTVLVDPHVAHWFAVEICHLLGFRKRRSNGSVLVFQRRNE
jgi:succinylglutamate desuccinylase